MRTTTIAALLLVITVLIACNKDNPEKEIKSKNVYINQEIGWKMYIPDDWEILDETTQGLYKRKGRKMVNEFNKENREYKGLIYLLGFKNIN